MVQVSLTKKNRETLLRIIPNRADDTGMTFSFRKKRNNEKKVSKQKLLKGRRQDQNITVLVMSTVSFQTV